MFLVIPSTNIVQMISLSCADPEGEGAGGPGPPETSQKYRVSYKYWSGTPENSQSYQVSIQCWTIIGPPAGPMMARF